MIPLLAIKFSPRFPLSVRSGLFAPIRLDRVGPPHRDVDAGESRWVLLLLLFLKLLLLLLLLLR